MSNSFVIPAVIPAPNLNYAFLNSPASHLIFLDPRRDLFTLGDNFGEV
jgi:hypothetical protein